MNEIETEFPAVLDPEGVLYVVLQFPDDDDDAEEVHEKEPGPVVNCIWFEVEVFFCPS